RGTAPPPALTPEPMPATDAAAGRGENGDRAATGSRGELVATGAASGAGLVGPVDVSLALLARVVERAPATGTPGAAGRRRRRAAARPLSPLLTKYRYRYFVDAGFGGMMEGEGRYGHDQASALSVC